MLIQRSSNSVIIVIAAVLVAFCWASCSVSANISNITYTPSQFIEKSSELSFNFSSAALVYSSALLRPCDAEGVAIGSEAFGPHGTFQTLLSFSPPSASDPILASMPKFLLSKYTTDPNSTFPDATYDSVSIGLLPNGTLSLQCISFGVTYTSASLNPPPTWLQSSVTANTIYNITAVFVGFTMSLFVSSSQVFQLDCRSILGGRCNTTAENTFILPGRWEYSVAPSDESLLQTPSSGIWSMYSSAWRCSSECAASYLSLLPLDSTNAYDSSLWASGSSPLDANATVTGALGNNTYSTASGRVFRFYNASSGYTYGATYFSAPNVSFGPYGMIAAKISYVVDVGSAGVPSPFCFLKKTEDASGSLVDHIAFCVEEGVNITFFSQRQNGGYVPILSPLVIPAGQSNSFDIQVYWSALSVFLFVNNSLAVVYTEPTNIVPSSRAMSSQPGYFIIYTLLNEESIPLTANTTWTLSDFQYSCGAVFAAPPSLASSCSGSGCAGAVTVTGGLDLSNAASSSVVSKPIFIERNLTVPLNRTLQVQVTSTNVPPLTVQGCAILFGALDLVLPSDYVPKSSDTFNIITARCVQGNFQKITVNTSLLPPSTLCLLQDTVATRDSSSAATGFAVLLSGTKTGSCKKTSHRILIIVLVVGILGGALLLGAFLTIFCWNRVRKGLPCCKDDWEVALK